MKRAAVTMLAFTVLAVAGFVWLVVSDILRHGDEPGGATVKRRQLGVS